MLFCFFSKKKEKSWQHTILYRGFRFWGLMSDFICRIVFVSLQKWQEGRFGVRVGGDYGVIQMTSLFRHKWQTCSLSTQDFLGQAHFTLGEVVGSLGSRSEKALGWVGVSAAWILISHYQNHCCSPEPVQHVSGVMLQMRKVAVWKKREWGSQTCKSTTTLCSPGWLDSLPPAAIQRRAADSKQLPVCGAMWASSLSHVQCCEFDLIWANLVSY